MSRNRGQKTLSAEDEITADSVNVVGQGIAIDGDYGLAGKFLHKNQVTNNPEWSSLIVPTNTITTAMIQDDAVTGAKLADDINITTSGNISTSGTGNIS